MNVLVSVPIKTWPSTILLGGVMPPLAFVPQTATRSVVPPTRWPPVVACEMLPDVMSGGATPGMKALTGSFPTAVTLPWELPSALGV